jgi:hypothetical protein
MHVFRLNKPIFDFLPDHPARRFLEAFVLCRTSFVGRELDGVDQEWFSKLDERVHTFSSFAYEWLSFDIELDGWLLEAPEITDSERRALERIPWMKNLMAECKAAALVDKNLEIAAMCDHVLHMLELWAECINRRLKSK